MDLFVLDSPYGEQSKDANEREFAAEAYMNVCVWYIVWSPFLISGWNFVQGYFLLAITKSSDSGYKSSLTEK